MSKFRVGVVPVNPLNLTGLPLICITESIISVL